MRSNAPDTYELRHQPGWHLVKPIVAGAFCGLVIVLGVVGGAWVVVAGAVACAFGAVLWLRSDLDHGVVFRLDAHGLTFPAPLGVIPLTVPWRQVESFVCLPSSDRTHRVGVVAVRAWHDAVGPVTWGAAGSFEARFQERIDREFGAPVAATTEVWRGGARHIRELADVDAHFAPHVPFAHVPHGLCRVRVRR
ncbi:hypothetical protein [Streptodolium elevatio]|uniref:Uncharacterized protein n=1 Tax=Streptodolium elevatio TaxID=3157996 RepID=A0ABV3DWK8_9ACTN